MTPIADEPRGFSKKISNADSIKFKKFGDSKKSIKMSDSFLAAKATYGKAAAEHNEIVYPDDTTSTAPLPLETKNSTSVVSVFHDEDEDMSCSDDEPSSPGGRFICKEDGCQATFSTRKDLRRHKLTHRERTHVCPMLGCGRAFFEKSKLKRHMVVHTKKKEHSCSICGKKFGYKANVKTHMRTHTGERPFACRVAGCGKTFAQASNRNAHEKTHFKGSEKTRIRIRNKSNDSCSEMSEDMTSVSVQRAKKRKASLSLSSNQPNLINLPGHDHELTDTSLSMKVARNNILDIQPPVQQQQLEKIDTSVRRSNRLRSRELELGVSEQLQKLDMPPADRRLFELDDFMSDIFKSNHDFVHDHSHTENNVFSRHMSDDSALANAFFNSFTSFGTNALHEAELNSMFKNDFGLNLDTLTEQDVFGHIAHAHSATSSESNHLFETISSQQQPETPSCNNNLNEAHLQ